MCFYSVNPMRRLTTPIASAILAVFPFLVHPTLGQSGSVPFPRDQIALQLGALQMGYVTDSSPTNVVAFRPTNSQQAVNALVQGRIALDSRNGWGTNNVVGASRPVDYGQQLDLAVMAVLAEPATNRISGRATFENGRSTRITNTFRLPPAHWFVPLPYAISAASPAGVEEFFGTNVNQGTAGSGAEGTLGQIILSAGSVVNGVPCNGQILPISGNPALFSLLGTRFGGDGVTTFALPDLRDVAPNGLTYSILTQGVFPSR